MVIHVRLGLEIAVDHFAYRGCSICTQTLKIQHDSSCVRLGYMWSPGNLILFILRPEAYSLSHNRLTCVVFPALSSPSMRMNAPLLMGIEGSLKGYRSAEVVAILVSKNPMAITGCILEKRSKTFHFKVRVGKTRLLLACRTCFWISALQLYFNVDCRGPRQKTDYINISSRSTATPIAS